MPFLTWNRDESPKKPDVEAIERQLSEETTREEDRYPRPLATRGWAFCGVIILDIVLALIPVCFIVFTALSMSLHKHAKSPFGEMVRDAVLFSPTVFPIMYAAILGKLLRRFGVWKAQTGVRIKTLERLIGSQSVYSAIERQIGLRSIDLLGLGLIILWLLSPLGGQASLRILDTEPRTVSLNDTIRYLPMEVYTQSFLISPNLMIKSWPRFAPLYLTALQLSKNYMNSSMDLWGSARIPDITSASSKLDDGWHTFIQNDTTTTYSSLFGLPMVGIPETGNSTFDVTSHYWAVDCEDFTSGTTDWNDTERIAVYAEWALWVSFTMDMNRNDTGHPQDGIGFTYTSARDRLIVDDRYSTIRTVSITKCSLQLKFVESRLECTDRSCWVAAMRYVQRSTKPFPGHIIANLGKFLPGMDIGLPQLRTNVVASTEMTEKWMVNPETSFDDADLEQPDTPWIDVSVLPASVFSKRLQTIINTFWDAALGSRYRNRDLNVDGNFSMCVTNFECMDPPLSFNSTQSSGFKLDGEQYICNKVFAIITIVVSLIIFVSAVLSLILAAGLTAAPDIFGYVATSLRDTPYTDSHVPSHLDGLESARVLGHVRVMVGDVKSEAEVGHVAVATVGGKVKRLEKGRLYD